jgi:pimeloyl-ACP methyl ester carboxylesterase
VRLVAALVLAVTMTAPALALAKPRWQELPLPPPMPTTDDKGQVECNGARIYYARYGKGDPVILLHGGLGNSEHWANQVPALADKFQVIAIDSRGQGRSTRTKAQASYDLMASDVLAVMDHLKLDKASLVGWSDGGEIALKIAIAHPERVAKLFVYGANYDVNGSKPRGGPPSATFNTYAVKCRADFERLSATPKQYNSVVDWLLPVWRNPMGFTKDQLRSIQAPTMIADGDHDEIIVREQIEEMAQLIPHAQLKIFTDTSHFALWQDPEAFAATLVEFLSTPIAKR